VAVLIGDGGHARDIYAAPYSLVSRVFRHHTEWDGSFPVIIGIADPQKRASLAEYLSVTDLAWYHPDSYTGSSSWGYGTHINYGVSMTRAMLGNHVTVGPGATICGDVVIGNRVLIGAGATICEKVTIEDDAVIGAGAVVLPGRWDIPPDGEQPGVAVPNVVPAGETWVGVPARPL
jgi:carbonic anhydrase/acetyltransferase-like protein (isoleucine patch superfamily)